MKTLTRQTQTRKTTTTSKSAVVQDRTEAKQIPMDWPLVGITMLLTLVGLFVIFDAGFARSIQKGSLLPPEFRSQLMLLPVALLAGAVSAKIRGNVWYKLTIPTLIASSALLLSVKVLGHELNGAQRWIKLGPVSVQPSEFSKVAIILFVAWVIARRKPWVEPKRIKDFADRLDRSWVPKLMRMAPTVVILVTFFCIEREPDLGTAAVVLFTSYLTFALGGITRKSLVGVSIACLILTWFMVQAQPYRMERIDNHLHRWENDRMDDVGYQTVQSEIAMASGGIIGTGVATGKVKHMMPAATTDFVMATVAEELGLVGTLGILGLLGVFVHRVYELGRKCTSVFGKQVCFGVAIWMTIQATVNLMMANGTLPPIGIPFPFISSGGSSLIALWLAAGIVLSVARLQKGGEFDAYRSHRRRNRRTRLSSH
jgi:cell division protein FtsW